MKVGFLFATFGIVMAYRNNIFELSNHLGNVLTTVSDRKLPVQGTPATVVAFYLPDVVSTNDYYPFGAPMPGRAFSSNSYRYGFNGQEKDDEVTGSSGNTNTAMFWEYDTRLGRRWNRDPKVKAMISDYSCFSNNPIYSSDVNGDEVDAKLDRRARKKLGVTRKEAKNFTPVMVKNIFAVEWGINVEMKNGKLVHVGDAATTVKVSVTARDMWIKELSPGFQSEHKLEFTFNNKRVDVGENVVLGEGNRPPTLSIIDLGDFNADFSIKDSEYYDVPIRSLNLGRVLEHEFLVHGVMGFGDDFSQSNNSYNNGSFDPNKQAGNTVIFSNRFAKEMGIPERSIYGAMSGHPWREGRKVKAFHIIRFSNHGSVLTVFDIR